MRCVQVRQVERGESPGPLGNSQDVVRAKPGRFFRHFRAQCPCPTGFSVGEPESFECGCLEL